jgi:hypothetical protein
VDWGQSLKQVRDWAGRNAQGQAVHLAYFGSFPPAAYGLNAVPYAPGVDAPDAGIYLVSAHFVARAPRESWIYREMDRASRPEMVGHAMYVYRSVGK